jgi:hypothetical protein
MKNEALKPGQTSDGRRELSTARMPYVPFKFPPC